MRSVHFISFAWFVGFILAHGVMVFVTASDKDTYQMFGGATTRHGPVFRCSCWRWSF
jgi:thiosulfate reductase cytochrome b subunit